LPTAAKPLAVYVKLVPAVVELDAYVYIDVVDRRPLIFSPPPKTAMPPALVPPPAVVDVPDVLDVLDDVFKSSI
jgi:hypothetical protein